MRLISGVLCCAFIVSSCGKAPSDACKDINGSTHYFAEYLANITIELEKTTDTAQALANMQAYAKRYKEQTDICVSYVNDMLKTMSNEAVLKHHETYISEPRVKRFLDAQDKFNEDATPEQIEALDELLTPLFLLSE